MSIAQAIRTFLDTLFPGKNRYIAHLEFEVNRLVTERTEIDVRLRHERDVLAAECERLRFNLPLPAAAYAQTPKPKLSTPSTELALPRRQSWAEIQNGWALQQEADIAAEKQKAEGHQA